jgi:hypothetical protein
MAQYLISFNDGAMTFPEEELPDVGQGCACSGAGSQGQGSVRLRRWTQEPRRGKCGGDDGTVTDGPNPETRDFIGGFTVVDVPTRDAALEWAAKIAVACRCAQEVREFLGAPGR